jgi:hypothetical protein
MLNAPPTASAKAKVLAPRDVRFCFIAAIPFIKRPGGTAGLVIAFWRSCAPHVLIPIKGSHRPATGNRR